MKKLQMNIPDELHKRLKRYCVEADKKMTEVVMELVENLLKKAEGKMKK